MGGSRPLSYLVLYYRYIHLAGGILTVISAGLRLPIGAHSYFGDIATSFIYAFGTLLYMRHHLSYRKMIHQAG
jgi:hypothetical protein